MEEFLVPGVAVAEGVGSAVFGSAALGVGVGAGVADAVSSAPQLTNSICGSGCEVSITQRWDVPFARFFRTRAPEPSVAAGARARFWSERGTRVPWRVKSYRTFLAAAAAESVQVPSRTE